MAATKRQEDSPPQANDAREPAARAAGDISALRADCLAQLKTIAARAQQLSTQASSDWMRAVNDAQIGAQMRQQSLFMDYLSKAQHASARPETMKELQELSTRCSSDFDMAREDAGKAIQDSREKLRTTVEAGMNDANREWDAACTGFVDALRQWLAAQDLASADPASLAAAGQSLTWIASLMRPPAAR